MSQENIIQLGILIVGMIGIFLTVMAAVKKGNKDVLKDALANAQNYDALEKRVALIEQKVKLGDTETRRELMEIKQILSQLSNQMHEHIIKLHTKE